MRSSTAPAVGFDHLDPFHLTGLRPVAMSSAPTEGPAAAVAAAPGLLTDIAKAGKPWSPENPLFWFGVLTAVTFGLIAGATTIKVGPFTAAVSAGNS